jgi:hypothetical protein
VAAFANALRNNAELLTKFFEGLAVKLLDKRNQILAEWLERGLTGLQDEDAPRLFVSALGKTAPLPQPLSQGLATWLQQHCGQPTYQRLVVVLRQYPQQGRYFHSASMLPLNILADVMER